MSKGSRIKSIVIEYKNDEKSRNKLIKMIIDYLISEKFNFGGEDEKQRKC